MKRFELNLTNNPSFNTILNLTNKSFDGTTIVSGRGATEDQLLVVSNHLDELEQAQEECCNNDWSAAILQNLSDRLDDLEARIEECCANSCVANTDIPSTCDGNTITVSFQWNNPGQTTGTATAVSADPTKTIDSFWFLVGNKSAGIYFKKKRASSTGDFSYTIDDSGNVNEVPKYQGEVLDYCVGIVAVDQNGCEGMLPLNLPIHHAVGG